LVTYSHGKGLRGNLTWTADNQIVSALDNAFHLAFGNIVPAGKKTLVGLDVSGSMTWGGVGDRVYRRSTPVGDPLTARQKGAAITMTFARTEPEYHTMAFGNEFCSLPLTSNSTLNEALGMVHGLGMQRTDCALPMIYAKKNNIPVDTFVVITDNETWYGNIHPFQALKDYRNHTGRNAKLAVIAMSATKFSIADPSDPGMMDFVGFDLSGPQVLNDFSRGDL
jgi:60 kDa SS-A/Ro ribonucleoprotein